MTNIKLTDDNDWAIEDGNLALVEGQEEIAQISKNRLLTFFGEWFMDTSLGLDYFGVIYAKQAQVAEIDNAFITEIIGVPGIISLRTYDSNLDPKTRQITVEYTAQTVDGILNFELTV